jgi:hypothetical protein
MTLDLQGIVDAYAVAIRRMLSDLDDVQLQELLKDPAKFDKLIKTQDQVGFRVLIFDDLCVATTKF